jgi:hypothetical protein
MAGPCISRIADRRLRPLMINALGNNSACWRARDSQTSAARTAVRASISIKSKEVCYVEDGDFGYRYAQDQFGQLPSCVPVVERVERPGDGQRFFGSAVASRDATPGR